MVRDLIKRCGCVCALIALCVPLAAAQQSADKTPPAPSNVSSASIAVPAAQIPPAPAGSAPLRVNVNLVVVPVVVRDRDGHAVGNLRKEDFRIFDNRKEQTIREFHVEQLSTPGAPGEKTLAPPAKKQTSFVPPERFTALFIDDVHLVPSELGRVGKALTHFLDGVTFGEERIGLFTASGEDQVDFSADATALRQAVDKLRARPIGGSNLKDCPDVSYYDADLIINRNDRDALEAAIGQAMGVCGDKNPKSAETLAKSAASRRLQLGDHERSAVLASLASAVARLAAAPGQRTIVFVSPGFLLTDGDSEQARIIEDAVRQKIIVNTLDTRGLYVDAEDGGDLVQSNIMLELAGATGGTFFHNSNNLDAGFQRLAEPPEFVYILGFSPEDVKADGKFHNLKVSFAEKSKLTLTARRGYYAAGGEADSVKTTKERMTQAIFSASNVHDLPVQLRTQFVRGDQPVARLTVAPSVDLALMPARQEQGQNHNDLNIVMAVFDSNGKYLSGMDKTFALRWTPNNDGTAPEGQLPHSNFLLRSGDYLIRVVICEAMSSRMSAETIAIRIP
jgi:VWFA-related protein